MSTPPLSCFKFKPRSNVHSMVLAALLVSSPLNSAFAEEPASQISIAAQPLGDALNALAKQTGKQLLVKPELISSKVSPAVSGKLSTEAALQQLLKGSGLESVIKNDAIIVQKIPAEGAKVEALPEVAVKSAKNVTPNDLPKPYAGGQVAIGSRLGLLGNADIFETPFSTKSYTKEYVQNIGALRMDEVLQNDPSIRSSLSQGQGLDQTIIRGFQVTSGSYLFNGLPGIIDYATVPVQNYERVEVIKGPNALLNGMTVNGSVGGAINLVPKRATDMPVTQVTTFLSDFGQYGIHTDVGRRFGPDNKVGFRLNLTALDGDGYADRDKNQNIAPQIALDYRGEKFRAVLDAGVNKLKRSGGVPNYRFSGTVLPSAPDGKIGLRQRWDNTNSESKFALVDLQYDILPAWTVKTKVAYQKIEFAQLSSIGIANFDNSGNFSNTPYLYKFDNERKVAEVGLNGAFATGFVDHKLALSATKLTETYGEFFNDAGAVTYVDNIYNSVSVAQPSFADGNVQDASQLKLNSMAIADTLSILDNKIALTLGARRQTVKFGDIFGTIPYNESKVTPAGAINFKVAEGVSLYGNYVEGLQQGDTAPLGTANQNRNLAPIQTEQREIGAKWNLGKFAITTAYFDIKRPFGITNAANVYEYGGEQRNRGFEIETFGEPWSGIRLLGGVAFINGKQQKTENGTTDGKDAIGTPDTQLNMGIEWDTPAIPGFTLTSRYIYTDSDYYDSANLVKVPSWDRIDLGARYKTILSSHPLTVRANIFNLTNDEHFEIAGRNILTVAPPRQLRLSATIDF